MILISNYNSYSIWQGILENNDDIWEGNPFNVKLNEETIFLQTRFYNSNSYHNDFVMLNDIDAIVGFLKYIFLPTAYETYLKDNYTIEYAIGDTNSLIDSLKETDKANKNQMKKMQNDINGLNDLWNISKKDKMESLEEFKNNYRNKWDNGDNVFCDFEIYYSPAEIIDNMIEGFGEGNMIDILEEQVGIKVEDINNLKKQVFEDEFLNKKFIDILNNKLESGLF